MINRTCGALRLALPFMIILVAVISGGLGCSSASQGPSRATDEKLLSLERQMAELKRMISTQASQQNTLAGDIQDSINQWRALYRGGNAGEQLFGSGQYDTVFKDEIFFDINEYELKKEDKDILDQVAEYMAKSPSSVLVLLGHADRTGPDFYNEQLSDERAKSAKRYLVHKYDIPLHRIYHMGMGSDIPKSDDDVGDNDNLNRRTEIILILLKAGTPALP